MCSAGLKSTLLIAAIAALVSACGGGGGDAGTPAGSFDVHAGLRNLLTQPHGYPLTGNANGVELKVTITITPLADGVFPVTGASSARVRQDVTISGLSIPAVSGSSTLHFNATTLAIIGSVNNDDNTCERTTSFTALPSSASVGGSGSLSTDDSLDRCTSPFVTVGNSTTTWSLEAEAGMALLCLNTTMRDLVGAVLGTESDCVEIIGSGALGTHARATVAVPLAGGTVTLVARNY